MTAVNLEFFTKQERGVGTRLASLAPWSKIGGIARAVAIITALILAAAAPMLLRLWLSFPLVHD